MGIFRGPDNIKDGLVFGYDTNYGVANNTQSTRFYKGRPVTNLWDSIDNTQSLRPNRTEHFWGGKKWLVSGSYTDPGVSGPQDQYLGKVFKFTSGALSSSWSGNSYGYMLRDIVSTSGNYYTMSSWIYASPDCNVDSLPSVIEGEAGGESAVNSHAVSYNLGNKGTWQRIAKKAISDGNTRFICLYPRRNGVTDGSFTGFFMFAAPQVEEGTETSPYLETGATRTSTQSLLDVTKNTDIDTSNMSFDVIGQPTFDGTDDYISCPNILGGLSSFTAEFVFFANTNPTGVENWLGSQYPGTGRVVFDLWTNGTLRNFVNGTAIYGSTVIQVNRWYHAVFTRDINGYATIHLNGDLESSGTISTTPVASTSYEVGGSTTLTRWFNGEIPISRIYGRAMTEEEIKQSFNTIKNRFKI